MHRRIKLAATIYFMGLGIVNLVMSILGKGITKLDVLILVLLSLPFFIPKKAFRLLYGAFSSIIWLVFLCAFIGNEMQHPVMGGPTEVVGSLTFLGMSLFFSLCLVYVGLSDGESAPRITSA